MAARASRQPSTASRIFTRAASSVLPCETQPGIAGHSATTIPVSSTWSVTRSFISVVCCKDIRTRDQKILSSRRRGFALKASRVFQQVLVEASLRLAGQLRHSAIDGRASPGSIVFLQLENCRHQPFRHSNIKHRLPLGLFRNIHVRNVASCDARDAVRNIRIAYRFRTIQFVSLSRVVLRI